MRYNLKDSHPLSFSKEWPDNIIILVNQENPTRVNWSFPSEAPESDTPVNSKREYIQQWIPMDTEENYNRLEKEGFKNRFTADSFVYELNKNGFRCDNFDTLDLSKKSIIYLGDSHTFGIGAPEEDIWCSILHKSLQEHYDTTFNLINLGIGGGSFDDYLRLMPYIKKFNPHMIVSYNPPMYRMFVPHTTGAEYCYPGVEKSNTTLGYNRLLLIDEYFEYKYDMTLQVIKSLADGLNIQFYQENISRVFTDKVIDSFLAMGNHGKNRDGVHYSREIHEIVAKYYFTMITEKQKEKYVYIRKN